MKKILLSMILISSFYLGKSQLVLNEIYPLPSDGNSEFIELYNSSPGVINTDCYTIMTYYFSGTTIKGWYVIDLPDAEIEPKGWYVLASSSPFSVQGSPTVIADLNWNNISFRDGSTGGYLQRWVSTSNGAFALDNSVTNNTQLNDILLNGNFANGNNYLTLLLKDGAVINGFWGGSNTGVLPATIKSMPNLTIPTAGDCGGGVNIINFSALTAVEFAIPAAGNDNGYLRTSDGKCGAWDKASAQVNHTPGITNGSAADLSGSLTTAQGFTCYTSPGFSTVTYNITGVTGDVTEADDFPVEVQLYFDYGTIGQLDGQDILHDFKIDNLIADPAKSFTDIPNEQPVIVVYKTKRGCFDKIIDLENTCITLPVKLKSFTASRKQTNVELKWTTTLEQNNSGFELQRQSGAGGWQKIVFVNSKATDGNSVTDLNYAYTDANDSRGVSQYRLMQIDLDDNAKYSEIRSVQGIGQEARTIISPNPSANGRVNVTFQSANVKRDLQLTDMHGRMLKQWNAYSDNSLQITDLTPGIYQLRIVDRETGTQTVEKIMVVNR